MMRTFNCGIGMVICVGASDVDTALQSLGQSGEQVVVLGEILDGDSDSVVYTE
jgi:phosphoribosylaminoimidazole (AIR) synthetase